jgi:hypothetical protein
MKTHMHRLRKKALAFTAIAACSLFYTTSCQKYEEPTAEQLEDAELVDYALQVIPDIHVEFADAIDLLNIWIQFPLKPLSTVKTSLVIKAPFISETIHPIYSKWKTTRI